MQVRNLSAGALFAVTAASTGAHAQTVVSPESASAPPALAAQAAGPKKVDYEITLPKGFRVVREEIGVGSQNKSCPSGMPIGPEAELLNPKSKVREGLHFKTPVSQDPEWMFSNGDYYKGHVAVMGKPSTPGAIATLELDVVFKMGSEDAKQVTKIFRLQTEVLPLPEEDRSAPCVPKQGYKALYVFAAQDFSPAPK